MGKHVILTLRTPTLAKLRGVLAEGDDAFVVLDQEGKGRTLVPIHAVLTVWSGDEEPFEELPERDLSTDNEAIREPRRG
jgi:hypothetical protein